MRKVFLFFLFSLIFTSCKKEPFFSDFDEVEYYRLKNDSLIDYRKKEDSLALKIFNEDFPNDLKNTDFFNLLNEDKFLNYNFNKRDVFLLKDIFVERNSFTHTASACIPNYRDILILKKNDSIIGAVKICLECEKYHFIGNNKNVETEFFGDNNEFEKLEEIFKKYK